MPTPKKTPPDPWRPLSKLRILNRITTATLDEIKGATASTLAHLGIRYPTDTIEDLWGTTDAFAEAVRSQIIDRYGKVRESYQRVIILFYEQNGIDDEDSILTILIRFATAQLYFNKLDDTCLSQYPQTKSPRGSSRPAPTPKTESTGGGVAEQPVEAD